MDDLSKSLTQQKQQPSHFLFLVDYELAGEFNGLDLIKKYNIAQVSILVTSRHEDEKVRLECESSGIKLLPKRMAGFIEIEIF